MTHRQLAVALVGTLIAASVTLSASSSAELRQFVSPDDYVGLAFTQAPVSGIYLYFSGDEPHVQVTFVNDSADTIRIELPAGNDGFSARLRGLDAHLMPAGDGDEVHVEPIKGPTLRLGSGTHIDMRGTAGVLTIQPGERVHWKFAVSFNKPVVPGLYAIQISSKWRCASGCSINPINSFVAFEWRRPTSREDRLEGLLRSALIDLWGDRLGDAELNIRELLLLYPESADAFSVQAKIAERRGDVQAAIKSYQAALSLLTDRRDTIRLSKAKSHEIDNQVITLRQEIQKLQR